MLALKVILLLGTLARAEEDEEAEQSEFNRRETGQFLEHLSFNFHKHELPVAYNTYGAAVQIHHHYSLLPDVPGRYGALTLNKVSPLEKLLLTLQFRKLNRTDFLKLMSCSIMPLILTPLMVLAFSCLAMRLTFLMNLTMASDTGLTTMAWEYFYIKSWMRSSG